MPDIGALLLAARARADEIRNNKRLWDAIRALGTQSLLNYTNAPPAIRHVVKDKASYLLSVEVLRVWYTRPDAATAAAFMRGVVQFGLSSKGRAASLIDFMRARGLLVRPPGTKPRILAPSAELVAHYGEGMRAGIVGLRALDSDKRIRIESVDDRLIREYIIVSTEVAVHVPAVAYPSNPPALALFFERNAGLLLLYALLEKIEGAPPTGEGPVSISAIARRLGVSRPHILKMLEDSHRQGFVAWDKRRRTVVLGRELLAQMAEFFTWIFAFHEVYLDHVQAKPSSPPTR